jgi:hypothetical protein
MEPARLAANARECTQIKKIISVLIRQVLYSWFFIRVDLRLFAATTIAALCLCASVVKTARENSPFRIGPHLSYNVRLNTFIAPARQPNLT